MKTSVVMTTYNGASFIVEMLESLKNQTRKIDEVLIFDDRSSDNTVEIIQRYIKEHNLEWEIRINLKNIGWELNFVQALSMSNGDIIFPCDQDDIWHLDKVEKMTAAFEENNDMWLLVSGYHAFSELGGKMVVQQKVRTEKNTKVSKVVFDEKYYQILRPGCTMAIRNGIFLRHFLELWEEGTPHDAILWIIASITGKLYLYNDTFIEYRRHDNNASKTIAHGMKYKVNEIARTKKVNDWYISSDYFDEDKSSVINECNIWCNYREQLIVKKRLLYWFKLYPIRKYYLTTKKYIGDLYYFIKKA